MYFKRFFKSGGKDYDPRQHYNAEFICTACNNIEWYPNVKPDSFDTEDRLCPECKSMGVEDRKNKLLAKKKNLEDQENKIRKEIEGIIKELDTADATCTSQRG